MQVRSELGRVKILFRLGVGGLEVPLLIWEVATAYLVGGLEVPLLIWDVATAYLGGCHCLSGR